MTHLRVKFCSAPPRKRALSGAIERIQLVTIVLTIGLTAVLVVVALFFAGRMLRPLDDLRVAAERLSRGDVDSAVPFTQRSDDLGRLARALGLLRETSQEQLRMQAEAEEQRRAAALEAAELQERRVAAAESLRLVVDSLAAGLQRLSAGDFSVRIERGFASDYEKLRTDFNAALANLEGTFGAVAAAAGSMHAATGTIISSAVDLAARTQNQAAQLETAAGTLAKVAAQVDQTATSVAGTQSTVDAARERASQSAVVVHNAVQAMSEIEQSSQQIQQIIGLIDEIAFQTNLLALNAAVEAARAGDQGRGFAVVAAEVRNLASRSSDAAKQIKTLILRSGIQVEKGTALVRGTGQELERIAVEVSTINAMVQEISANSLAQARDLRDVNAVVSELDNLTRGNADCVAEWTESSRRLAAEAIELTERIGRFRISAAATGPHVAALNPQRRRM
jgi:methyl-accepting chemotaxis protein